MAQKRSLRADAANLMQQPPHSVGEVRRRGPEAESITNPKAVAQMLACAKGADEALGSGKFWEAAQFYSSAANIAREICPAMEYALREEAAESAVKAGIFLPAEEEYERLSELVSGPQKDGFHEKSIICSILGGPWERRRDEIAKSFPSLFATLQQFEDPKYKERYKNKESSVLRNIGVLLSPAQLEKVARIFLLISRDEVKISPDRVMHDIFFFCEGVRVWARNGFREHEAIPEWFAFQAWAASQGDPEKLAAFAKICGTKVFRHSKDRRKELMWYMEDNKCNEPNMAAFYRLVSLSSSKKMLDNIRLLSTLQMLEIGFTMDGMGSQDEFLRKAKEALSGYMMRKAQDENVAGKFVERLDSLHQSGFLGGMALLYSRYNEGYQEAQKLLDIALAAEVMGDFAKVKYPTKEGVEGMAYPTPEQKALLLGAVGQLDFLGGLQPLWKAETRIMEAPEGAAGSGGLVAYDSSDAVHLIRVGWEPENSGSCIRPDANASKVIRLSAILLNSAIKAMRVEDSNGIVLGRAILRAVLADGEPALFLQQTYYRDSRKNPEVERMALELAKRKADGMGVPLLCASVDGGHAIAITVVKGISPHNYADELNGPRETLQDGSIRYSIQVNVLCGSLPAH